MALQSLRTASAVARSLGQREAQPAWNGAWKRLFTSSPRSELGSAALRPSRILERNMPLRTRNLAHPTPIPSLSRRGFRFTAWRGNADAGQTTTKPYSLRDRLRRMIRDYGWTAVGVYLALSVLDFPFCFLLVRVVGVDTIGRAEHYVVSGIQSMIPSGLIEWVKTTWSSVKRTEKRELGDNGEITEKVEMAGWGVEKAQEKHREDASIWTQLALAYAIHKSFIFLRIPLTAAVLPKVVRVLRSWGWKIGKRTAV